MKRIDADVLVLGSGFGGSLLSLILAKIGKRVALVDRALHPRFAIGESSTPLADFVLSDLARRYGLEKVAPLASFGSWQRTYPHLRCGLKRGFTYFHHRPDETFSTDANNTNQLLVAASSDDLDSDTHWHRADVDEFLFGLAQNAGVECFESTAIRKVRSENGWRVEASCEAEEFEFAPKFIVDASGAARVMHHQLGIADATAELKTKTRAIFGHFENVQPFAAVLDSTNISREEHPYLCDNAALHHLFGGQTPAWMWNLRFADGIVSAGIVTTNQGVPLDQSAADEWREWLARFPSVRDQFEHAVYSYNVSLRRTDRLQRLSAHAGGAGWLSLPNTTGFIDPMHSTGIAHTLSAVERIARMFEDSDFPGTAVIRSYSEHLREELGFIDELVSGCYAAMPNFELFKTWCMLYFASAHSCEMRRVGGEAAFENGFLGARLHDTLCPIVKNLRPLLEKAIAEDTSAATERFKAEVRDAIEPFNLAGLLDPAVRNMYANTAPPRGFGSIDFGQSQA